MKPDTKNGFRVAFFVALGLAIAFGGIYCGAVCVEAGDREAARREAVLKEFQAMEFDVAGVRFSIMDLLVMHADKAERNGWAFEFDGWKVIMRPNDEWDIGFSCRTAGQPGEFLWRYNAKTKTAAALNDAASEIHLLPPR